MSKLLEQINSKSKIGSIKDLVFPVSNTYNFTGKDKVIFINTGDVFEGKFLHNNYSSTKKLPGQAKKIIELGDILFSEIRPKNRHFALVDFDSKDYVVSTKLIVLKVKEGVDQKYAYIALTADQNLREFQNIAESRSGTFPQITFESIADYEVNIPDLPTQKKIAEILSVHDAKIENNNLIINKLEATAQTLFDEWFVNFRFPGYEKVKFADSEMGEIPKEWEILKMKDIFTFIKGKKPKEVSEVKKENFLQQILIDSFEGGKKLFADKEGMVVASDEDLLMVMDGASSGRIEFGISGVVGSTLSKLDLKRPIRTILYLYLKYKEKDIKENTTGSAIPHTDKDKVYNYEIVLPKNTDLLENKLFKFIEHIRGLKDENISLKSQRDQLLAKLI